MYWPGIATTSPGRGHRAWGGDAGLPGGRSPSVRPFARVFDAVGSNPECSSFATGGEMPAASSAPQQHAIDELPPEIGSVTAGLRVDGYRNDSPKPLRYVFPAAALSLSGPSAGR